jgi:hypothetical protein
VAGTIYLHRGALWQLWGAHGQCTVRNYSGGRAGGFSKAWDAVMKAASLCIPSVDPRIEFRLVTLFLSARR